MEHQLFSTDEYRLFQECVHCGICLAACPTYTVNSKEADSPRGRLLLMAHLDSDLKPDSNGALPHLDLCLGCLACQTVCPSGVRYGQLLELTRGYQRREIKPLPWLQRALLKWFTEVRRLRILTAFVRLVQKTRLDRLIRTLHLLPSALRFQLAGLPRIPKRPFSPDHARYLAAAAPDGQRRGVVALFTGCIMDYWYADVHAATMRVLRWNGFDVIIPEDQTCCGALHAHAGREAAAEHLLNLNLEVFRAVEASAVIVNSAGCGAQLKKALGPDNGTPPAMDVNEWLADHLTNPPQAKLTERTSFDAPCHLHHAQDIHDAPYYLLELACEQLVPLPEADICCGSAGVYSLIHNSMSRQVLSRKIKNIRLSDPALLVTANPGCHMQLQAGLCEAGIDIPVYYTIQVLDHAYHLDDNYRRTFNLPDNYSQL